MCGKGKQWKEVGGEPGVVKVDPEDIAHIGSYGPFLFPTPTPAHLRCWPVIGKVGGSWTSVWGTVRPRQPNWAAQTCTCKIADSCPSHLQWPRLGLRSLETGLLSTLDHPTCGLLLVHPVLPSLPSLPLSPTLNLPTSGWPNLAAQGQLTFCSLWCRCCRCLHQPSTPFS